MIKNFRIQNFFWIGIPFSWLSGLLLPYLYLLFSVSFLKIKKDLFKDKAFIVLIVFLVIQVISLLLSLINKDFSINRFIAAIHNVVVYCFIFIGINNVHSNGALKAYRLSYPIFVSIIWFTLFATIFSFIIGDQILYNGILSYLSENKYTVVRFNWFQWHIIENFPRTSVLSIFPNITGLIMIILYPMWKVFDKKMKFSFYDILFLFICFMTGSRLILVLAFSEVFLSLLRNKTLYLLFVLLLPFGVVLIAPFLSFLFELRLGSNNQRLIIYQESLKYLFANNFITGIGIKPYMDELGLGSHYPLGSHSSLIGYFFKTGLIGGFFITIVYFDIFLRYFLENIRLMFSYAHFDREKLFLKSCFVLVLIGSLIDDFDAFEVVMLVFGIFVGIIYNKDED